MTLILLVKVQSGVFTTNRSEAQGIYREVVAEGPNNFIVLVHIKLNEHKLELEEKGSQKRNLNHLVKPANMWCV